MAKYHDYSRIKKNELGKYLFKKEYSRFLAENEKKKKKEANPFASTIYSSIVSVSLLYFPGVSLIKNQDSDSRKIIMTLLLALFFTILYYIFQKIYTSIVTPALNNLTDFLSTSKKLQSSNPDQLLTPFDQTEVGFVEKFNHQVVDRIALVLSVTEDINRSNDLTPEEKFYISEVFQYFTRAVSTLHNEIIQSNIYSEKISKDNFPLIRKHRILELIPVTQNILSMYKTFWNKADVSYQEEIQKIESKLSRIKADVEK